MTQPLQHVLGALKAITKMNYQFSYRKAFSIICLTTGLILLFFTVFGRHDSDSDSWQMTSFSGSNMPDIALTSEGNPCVTWHRKTEIYLRCWDGQSWIELDGSASGGGISNDASKSYFPAIAIDNNDNIYIAWANQEAGNDRVYIKQWDGERWKELGDESASGMGISEINGASAPDIAITSDNVVFIVWGHRFNGPIYAKQWDGLNWKDIGENSSSQLGIGGLAGESGWPTIVLSDGNTPYVVWEHELNNEQTFLVTMFNGENWETLGGRSVIDSVTSNMNNNIFSPEMDVTTDETPYITWEHEDDIFVQYWNGDQWLPVTKPSVQVPFNRRWSAYRYSTTNLISDLQGGFFLVLSGSIESKYDDIYVQHFVEGEWVSLHQDSSANRSASDPDGVKMGGDSYGASIAVNKDNLPILAWEDKRNGVPEIFVGYWDGTKWMQIGNDGDAGRYEDAP
jgi:hypothetical protein